MQLQILNIPMIGYGDLDWKEEDCSGISGDERKVAKGRYSHLISSACTVRIEPSGDWSYAGLRMTHENM